MNADVKRLWTEALRSGEYTQTTGTLYDPFADRHCATGVLCALYRDAHDDGLDFVRRRDVTYFGHEHEDSVPTEVADWAGVAQSDAQRVADYNDRGSSFSKIADYVESVM